MHGPAAPALSQPWIVITTRLCIITASAGGVTCDLGWTNEPDDTDPRPTGGVFCFMDYSKLDGLIPAVIQDAESAEVLMVGFMNERALAETRRTGFATFFSRSRGQLWTKGETSGNRLQVTEILVDCDDDTVLVKVMRLGQGNVCHTGERTCFFRTLDAVTAGDGQR